MDVFELAETDQAVGVSVVCGVAQYGARVVLCGVVYPFTHSFHKFTHQIVQGQF